MIAKNYKEGKLFQPNESEKQIVLIDPSETMRKELSTLELSWNCSMSERSYEGKELVFIPASGEATLRVEERNHVLLKNDLFYLPANTSFLLANNTSETLELIVYSAFLSEKKGGYTSFAEFFAVSGQGNSQSSEKNTKVSPKLIRDYKSQKYYEFGSNGTYLMICRSEAAACEVTVFTWPPRHKGAMVSHSEKEQTFFVIKGSGWITIDSVTKLLKTGDIVRIPFRAAHTTEAGEEELTYFCMNTIVTEETEATFEAMYRRVAKTGIKRWQTGDDSVGE